MSEDFLKNPLSLFDVRGKTAIITGATGAFGAIAAKTLAGELTVIAGGKEMVARAGDSVYIGPNESREILNRSNEVCTIAVAVAPVK